MTETPTANKLVVAQLIESVTMGGAENLAVRIANALADQGHRSHLIVLGGPDILSGKISDQVQAHYLHFSRASIKNPPAFVRSLGHGFGLLKSVLLENGIQVLQTHLPGSNFWGLLLTLRGWQSVLATIHNNQEFRYGDADNPLRAALRKEAYKMILRRCAGTVAVSDEVKTSLIRDLGAGQGAARRIGVVTNGVAIPALLDPQDKQKIRASLGIADDRVFILAAGRLSDQKNFMDMVLAAAQLRRTCPGFRLVICGEGEHRPALEKAVAQHDLGDHVSLPGNRTDLDTLMQAADVFAMSSLWEGLPLVLLEAMAAGLPAVGFDIKGVDEIIAPGSNGLTAPTGDTTALAACLQQMITDPEGRHRMGAGARQLIRDNYNFEDLVRKLVGLYQEAVTGRNRNRKA